MLTIIKNEKDETMSFRTQYYPGLQSTYVIQDDDPLLQFSINGSEEKFHETLIKQAKKIGYEVINTSLSINKEEQ